MRTETISVGDLEFLCRRSGTAGGEGVVLLHGFPETSLMWSELMPVLADAGYDCIAPDQRGYSPGARPDGAENYTYTAMAEDVMALADAAGFERFHLIGHDHGAGLGWTVAAKHAPRLLSWTALSIPHVAAFRAAMTEDSDQQERSQYIGVFQQPGVAEQMMSADDFAGLKSVWQTLPQAHQDEYLAVLSAPGALTAALNWYRGALAADQAEQAPVGDISLPTLLIWGNQDQAVGRRGCELAEAYMKGPYRFVEADAGHWLAQEVPDLVATEVVAHLKQFGAS